jgi:hypothetical protein
VVHQIKTIKLVELNFIFKENALLSRKRKTNFSWPLTLIMQKRDHYNDVYLCFIIFCIYTVRYKEVNQNIPDSPNTGIFL